MTERWLDGESVESAVKRYRARIESICTGCILIVSPIAFYYVPAAAYDAFYSPWLIVPNAIICISSVWLGEVLGRALMSDLPEPREPRSGPY